MINVIFGLAFALIIISIAIFINSITEGNEFELTLSIFICIIAVFITTMSDKIRHEPNNFDIIDGTAKYNEVLYINETDTIKLYDIVRIDKDDKK